MVARAAGAGARRAGRSVLTSRNLGLPLRRAIASRNPDLLKSNGGGANAILVRGEPIARAPHAAAVLVAGAALGARRASSATGCGS